MLHRDLLYQQTQAAYTMVHRLVDDLPDEQWPVSTPGLNTTVLWQMGHLIISTYYHTIMVIRGHDAQLLAEVPIKTYGALFTRATPVDAVFEEPVLAMRKHFDWVTRASLHSIKTLADSQFDAPLEPTHVPHPMARVKHEALQWNQQHTWWHCGQLGMLRRAVYQRLDFGLQD